MRIVVCVKEVLDPDAVNNYALAGRLEIGEDGKTLTQTTIPRLMNGFDEQAIEAALRLRDAGAECTITVVSAGSDPANLLKHAAALGADQIALQKSLKVVQGEVSGWKGDLAAKEKIAAERLGELDRQIEVKEQRLQELTAKLDDVRARATV